jgi:hypothetical protein
MQASQAAQYAAENMASIPVAQAPVPDIAPAEPMDVDSGPRGTKRAAEDSAPEEGHKKARMGRLPFFFFCSFCGCADGHSRLETGGNAQEVSVLHLMWKYRFSTVSGIAKTAQSLWPIFHLGSLRKS